MLVFQLKKCSVIVLWLIVVFVQGCTLTSSDIDSKSISGNPVLPQPDNSPFPLVEDIVTQEQIFQLTPQQKNEFLTFYYAKSQQDVRPDHRLYNYMEDKLANFDFRGETYNASTALSKLQGNCMSLAVVTTALARLVDLELTYQKVNSTPVYRKQKKLLTVSSHVRTKILDPWFKPEKNQFVFFRSGTVIDYFPSSSDYYAGKVEEQDFIAKYYQNVAAEAMVEENYAKAFYLLQSALLHSPLNPESINMLAVLYSKAGYSDLAEIYYRFGVDNNLGSINLYSNYHQYLLKTQQTERAAGVEAKLDLSDDRNPYAWLKLGHEAKNRGAVKMATYYYKKAIRFAPYLGEGYFALAKVHYQAGEVRQATAAMEIAVEKAYTPESRKLYYDKLSVLKKRH